MPAEAKSGVRGKNEKSCPKLEASATLRANTQVRPYSERVLSPFRGRVACLRLGKQGALRIDSCLSETSRAPARQFPLKRGRVCQAGRKIKR